MSEPKEALSGEYFRSALAFVLCVQGSRYVAFDCVDHSANLFSAAQFSYCV